MSAGAQSVQSQHALTDFIFNFSEIANEWHKTSNYLVNLAVKNEIELNSLIQKAQSKNIKFSIFREPDLDNQITAIALEPCDETRKLCSSIPKALKEFERKEVQNAA